VLQFNVGLQRIAQARREDIDLVLFSQPVAAGEEGQEFALVICHRALATKLNQFTQRIAPQRRPESLIDKADEFLPQRLARLHPRENHCDASPDM
jgi:hypothetical protein